MQEYEYEYEYGPEWDPFDDVDTVLEHSARRREEHLQRLAARKAEEADRAKRQRLARELAGDWPGWTGFYVRLLEAGWKPGMTHPRDPSTWSVGYREDRSIEEIVAGLPENWKSMVPQWLETRRQRLERATGGQVDPLGGVGGQKSLRRTYEAISRSCEIQLREANRRK